MQASLQKFAWTEAHRDGVIAERAAQCGSESQRAAVLAEPVFCFETACKALYWSMLVYRIQARPRPRTDLMEARKRLRPSLLRGELRMRVDMLVTVAAAARGLGLPSCSS